MSAVAPRSFLPCIGMLLAGCPKTSGFRLVELNEDNNMEGISTRSVCTVAEENAPCQYTDPPTAPCCDEAQGFQCLYSYQGNVCGKIAGWYPVDWVTKTYATPPNSMRATVPFWQLAEASFQQNADGDDVVVYEGGQQVLRNGGTFDWSAFSNVWWWGARNTTASASPAPVLRKYCGGSSGHPTRDGAVNDVLSGRVSPGTPTRGDASWTYGLGVEHYQELFAYAVELADALNALDSATPAGGRVLHRGGWHSSSDIQEMMARMQGGQPLAHPLFMSMSMDENHAKEFTHPMFCAACAATHSMCKVCPDSDQHAVMFEITTSYGKEIRDIAGNLWEQEFILLPNTPLRVNSVEVFLNSPVGGVGEEDWNGRLLRGRIGRYGENLVNEQPQFYLVKLSDYA